MFEHGNFTTTIWRHTSEDNKPVYLGYYFGYMENCFSVEIINNLTEEVDYQDFGVFDEVEEFLGDFFDSEELDKIEKAARKALAIED